MNTLDCDGVMRRAFAAYFRAGGVDTPDRYASGVEVVRGKNYAVLRNVRGLLECYRIRNDLKLKKMIRVPAKISAG